VLSLGPAVANTIREAVFCHFGVRLDQSVAELQEEVDDHENGFPETATAKDSQLHSQPRMLYNCENFNDNVISFNINFMSFQICFVSSRNLRILRKLSS
jgi:hypothetical protein